MPAVTRDTTPQPGAAAPPGPDPAARVRRLVGSAREHAGTGTGTGTDSGTDAAGLRALESALARFDAPLDLRIRGGLGSGRRTLAAALRGRRGWRAEVDDVDGLARPDAPAGRAPDVEIVCLRTAPCRHEEAWLRRPRVHPLLVVATGVHDEARPRWAEGLHAVDARRAEHSSVDAVVGFVDRALENLGAVRTARLAAELERLAVRDGVGELAEAALCALDGTART